MQFILIRSKDDENWERVGTMTWTNIDELCNDAWEHIKVDEEYYYEGVGLDFWNEFHQPFS